MLERGVQAEVQEDVFRGRNAGDLPGYGPASRPKTVGIEGKKARAGSERMVELQHAAPNGVQKRDRVIRARDLLEPLTRQQAQSSRPALEGPEVHVGHG